MDIVLTQGTVSVTLPVLPQGYTVTSSQGNTSVQINAAGELSLFGTPDLDVISFDSFFPAEAQSYSLSSILTPAEYRDAIIDMQRTGPVKLHLLDVLSKYVTIETFECSEQDGTGDIYYSLELKEYKYINVDALTNTALSVEGRSDDSAAGETETAATYTVKSGDCLWSIARSQLGTSDWTELYNLNVDVIGSNPNLIYPGQVLTLPS